MPNHFPPGFTTANLFEPDVLIGERRGTLELSPEKKLMLAVLEDGIDTFLRHAHAPSWSHHGRALHAEAAAWIDSEATNWPFAFERLCEALGLEAEYLRRGLRARVDALIARRVVDKVWEKSTPPECASAV